jgi:hypothetical protein
LPRTAGQGVQSTRIITVSPVSKEPAPLDSRQLGLVASVLSMRPGGLRRQLRFAARRFRLGLSDQARQIDFPPQVTP